MNTTTKLSVAMLMGALLAGCTQTQTTNNDAEPAA